MFKNSKINLKILKTQKINLKQLRKIISERGFVLKKRSNFFNFNEYLRKDREEDSQES